MLAPMRTSRAMTREERSFSSHGLRACREISDPPTPRLQAMLRHNFGWHGAFISRRALGERSDALMSADPQRRSETLEWLFAALTSIEMASLPWSLFKFVGDTSETPGRKHLNEFLKA